MKLVSYLHRGTPGVGALEGDSVVALSDLTSSDQKGGAMDLVSLIERWDEVKSAYEPTKAPRVPLSDITVTAPIPRPRRNVFCIGKNYAEHAEEFGRSGYDATGGGSSHQPDAPVFFTKPPSCVIGPDTDIQPHVGLTSELDYEAELGVIIGRGGRGISRADALAHVWGYTIINDVTARDLQKKHKQWFLGKGLDTFCPMGPWAVTADEVGAEPLEVVCLVNREERQRARTSDLIFDIPAIIEALSAGITLEPGDVIATGTPKGVGIGFDPPRFLHPGDVIEISITNLGTLRNEIGGPRR